MQRLPARCSVRAQRRDEDRVLAAVRKAYPGTAVDRAVRTPMPGVYEIWMGANVAFVSSKNPRYMVFGRLVDLKTMRDLTDAKLRAARVIEAEPSERAADGPAYIGPMPVADAITVKRGTGRRVLSVFTDPSCGYCRQLEHELQKLTDVTIHYYLLPFQGREAPLAIWCAKDRPAAYAAAMGDAPMSVVREAICEHPIDRNQALAAKLRVQATPTLLFGDGALVPGVMSADELDARLSAMLDKSKIKEGVSDATLSFE
ncbi:DsbC family protein [Pseudoduganella sp. UC29_106]|uniref:DsbC family protein n=1 Tax=Pseudoduganella sp. UC29_106 TaxID=3374553 RepID=UPI003756C9FC